MTTRLAGIIQYGVLTNSSSNAIAERLAHTFSRIKIDPKEDFACTYHVDKGGLVIKLTPISKYGEFIMQEVVDTEIKEELDKK